MKSTRGLSLVALLLALIAAACSQGAESRLVVAAGTTVVDSGFIDHLATAYEESHSGVEVSVVGNPTQLAIELGEQKAADLLITHAPRQEAEFINSGGASDSAQVFESRFVVLGPKRWLGVVTGFEAPEAFRAFAQAEQPFVSRGDRSGTNDAEDLVWLESGLNPTVEDWYVETGQGMGPTILVADQRDAVTFAEIGSFIVARDTVTIVDLVLDEGGLENPYTSIVVRGAEGEELANEFHAWLLSSDGVAAILEANDELFGAVVYSPPDG